VVDEIVTEVSRRQNNLITHLGAYVGWRDRIPERSGPYPDPPDPLRTAADTSIELIAETQSPFGDMSKGHAGSWRKVLEQLPSQSIRQINSHPKFLVSAAGGKSIDSQMTRLRPGCPLVHLALSSPADLARHSEASSALLEGCYPLENGTRTVKGNILITDPMRMLMTAAQTADERTTWLGQLLWLTDGDSGPDVPRLATGAGHPSKFRMEPWFRDALGRVMTYRFGLPDLGALVLFADPREAAARWSDFLKEMEPRLPGITGAARNLLSSLVFGLGVMVPGYSGFTLNRVEAVARFLIRRMANARVAILHAGEVARRKAQISRVFYKLGDGPTDERKLCRALKISAADRDEALRWLEQADLVIHRPDAWERREGARLSFADSKPPLIEV
jgi:hypothetical protein